MSLSLSAVLADNGCADYCIGLEVSDNMLAGLFNSSNSVLVFDLPSATLAGQASFPEQGVVKACTWLEGPAMAVCGSTRSIAFFDTRSSEQTGAVNSQNTENYAIDYSTNHLAVAGNKCIQVWDIRNMSQKQVYKEVHMDDFDITSVEFCPLYCNNLASTSEDGLLGLMDIHSEIEDDWIVLNIDEAGLRVGHLGLDVFTISMGSFQKWNVSQEDPNATPAVSASVSLTQLGNVDYFINAFDLNGVQAYAAGTHTGALTINTVDNIQLLQGLELHSETIREVRAYNGAIITGGEDGRIVISNPV